MTKGDGSSFIIKEGKGRVMFSAPHCVEQRREGRIKFSEPQTGLLVEMLHNEFGCPVIRKVTNCNDDANYDPISDYRDALEAYIKGNGIRFLIDLHQLSPTREVMINLGTGRSKNISDKELIAIFTDAFAARGMGAIQLDVPFSGGYEYTVSSSMHKKCNIPCLQVEINSRLVYGGYKEYDLKSVYEALSESYIKLEELYDQR